MRWGGGGKETAGDFWRALATLLLLLASFYCLTLAAAAYAQGPA